MPTYKLLIFKINKYLKIFKLIEFFRVRSSCAEEILRYWNLKSEENLLGDYEKVKNKYLMNQKVAQN